ncbi:PepSY domain-containing protein [Sphingobium jiangsuense]|nr:PepSY domain-containing protein [Sphingobium jiangsuense]
MGFQLRIAAVMALAALGACDRDAARDDPRASSLTLPPDKVAGDQPDIEIAGPGGEAQPLPTAGPARLPLARILELVRARVPGEVIEVELEDENGRPEYEVTILTADGRSIETQIDAISGAIRKSEEE